MKVRDMMHKGVTCVSPDTAIDDGLPAVFVSATTVSTMAYFNFAPWLKARAKTISDAVSQKPTGSDAK